jgi:hypothetical protein
MVQLSDSTQNPAWPGLRILQMCHEFFPKIEEWRDPIPPLILPGSHFSEAPYLPSCKDMQFHIAAVMGSARLPTVCTTNKGLMKQWSKAIEDVERLEKLPLITWPEVARPATPTGELYVSFTVSISNKFYQPELLSSVNFQIPFLEEHKSRPTFCYLFFTYLSS